MADETTATATATALDPADVGPIVSAIKSGWRTSEFWITLAVVGVGTLLASGVLGDGSTVAKLVGGAMATVKGATYTLARTRVKS